MTIGMYTFLLILRCINEIKGINHYVMRAIKVCIFFVCMLIPIIVGGSRIVIFDFLKIICSMIIDIVKVMC